MPSAFPTHHRELEDHLNQINPLEAFLRLVQNQADERITDEELEEYLKGDLDRSDALDALLGLKKERIERDEELYPAQITPEAEIRRNMLALLQNYVTRKVLLGSEADSRMDVPAIVFEDDGIDASKGIIDAARKLAEGIVGEGPEIDMRHVGPVYDTVNPNDPTERTYRIQDVYFEGILERYARQIPYQPGLMKGGIDPGRGEFVRYEPTQLQIPYGSFGEKGQKEPPKQACNP